MGDQGWTEQHKKEVQVNNMKRAMALLDAHKSGTTVEGEMTEDYLKASKLNDLYQLKLSAEYAKRKPKNLHSIAGKTDLDLAGKRIHVDSNFKGKDSQELTKLLQQERLRRVTDRGNADVFLTADVNFLGQRTSWSLMLGGGLRTLSAGSACWHKGAMVLRSASPARLRPSVGYGCPLLSAR